MRHLRFSVLVALAVLALTGCDNMSPFLCSFWNLTCDGKRTSAAASPGDALYVTATAHVAGALGTNWRSDVEVHNLSDETALLSVWLLEHGADNTSAAQRELTLAPGRCVRLGDVLASEFGVDGQAALLLVPSSGRIVVTSRTYNLLGPGNDLGLPPGSTFGQYIPAQPLGEAIRFGEQGRLIQLSHSTAIGGGFRTNLGLVNAKSQELTVEVDLHTADGALLGTVPVVLPPLGYRQLNRVFATVTGGDVDDGYAVVRATTGGGRFFAYASVVDNLTGDPVAITAVRLPEQAAPGAGPPVYVVASAHSAGTGGTNWRTDLEVHCWSDGGCGFTVELLEHGVDNSTPEGQSFTLGAGASVRFGDILDSVFGFEGAAALRVAPTAGRIVVTSRTYNLLGDGNQLGLPPGSTFGQFIPGVTASAAIGFGEEGRLVQLSHTPAGGSGFRTNLILVNATAVGADLSIELHTADGTLLGTHSRTLAPYEYRQLNRLFELVTDVVVVDGYAVVRTSTEGAAFFALASVVDNLTGDPVGMTAPVILSPEGEVVLGAVEGVYDKLRRATFEGTLDWTQGVGVGGVLDQLASAQPEVTTRTGSTLVIDYGDGYTTPEETLSGAMTIDMTDLEVTAGGISGTMTITHDDLLIDGEAPLVGPTAWTFDLSERADGSVEGVITVGPAGQLKRAGDLTGELVIDTLICPRYPISGSLRFQLADQILTINLSSSCHPVFERTVEPVPSGQFVGNLLAVRWSFGGSSAVGTIDSTTGEWHDLGESGYPRLNALARDGAGRYYSVSETETCGASSLITIDPETGAGTMVGPLGGLSDERYVAALAFALGGTLYAATGECGSWMEPEDELYTVDPATGAAALVGVIDGQQGVGALDFDDASGTLYGWDYQTGLITIDPSSAVATDVNPAVVGPNMLSLVILPDGTMVGGQNALFSIDPATGESTQIGDQDLANVRGIEVLDSR